MKKYYKIVFTDYYFPDIKKEIKQLEELGEIEVIDCNYLVEGEVASEDQLIDHLQKNNALDADAVFVNHAHLTEKFISRLTNCKVILRYGIGIDNIDAKFAQKKGIKVSNVPNYCIIEVAENTIALMIATVRKIFFQNKLLRNQQFDYEKVKPIRRFSDLTVGLLAFGNIARKVAERLKGFGVKIIAHDPYFEDKDSFEWIEFVSFEQLLKNSDVLSVHAPLNEETYHLINQKVIENMKKGIFIINTSRGGLIDEQALYDALVNGKIAGAGLDLLEYKDENEYVKSKLMDLDNVFITPHTSWYSEEAVYDLQIKAGKIVYQELLKVNK
ncbi:MAG: C-terminal binding protein [Elusimicrobiota bacterium]